MAIFDMLNPSSKGHASQSLIKISEIRDGILILNDGTMRNVLMISSVNFALKSEEEQNAIIYAYQEFINSLDFSIQLTVSSRKMDITAYLEEVKRLRDLQKNELLHLQMTEYINFIAELVKGSNIMTKTFFVTIPFSVAQSKKEGAFGKISKGAKGATGKHVMSDVEFEHNKTQILHRVEQIAIGLRGIGLRVVPLQTQELLELFYNYFNPKTSRNQRLRNVTDLKLEETEAPL
ncbi:MAG: hypothetical protein A3E36_04175 [Candidatus Andersenbacteria bacterium RIFCSPHIGHO2_12_FULL_45_11b]|uniref:TraC-like domain-containing protein n=1 Tax=Candidatus Andersenbacteria bacterium RIFCSPHIGHO2_12_FULL_45_11b TaxID=1797282 RepID=A0A1G1XAX7_9BACT|nr:MAG: hypothetical protein A3E36_04175 [Candidatus Andersenbacteria bacterium RIFCSPHIGHO2_12_FULL_45_11b]